MPEPPITTQEKYLLDVYALTFRHESNRLALIERDTGLKPVEALLVLNGLLDTERALAYAPMTVRRLLRQRDQRARSRLRRVSA